MKQLNVDILYKDANVKVIVEYETNISDDIEQVIVRETKKHFMCKNCMLTDTGTKLIMDDVSQDIYMSNLMATLSQTYSNVSLKANAFIPYQVFEVFHEMAITDIYDRQIPVKTKVVAKYQGLMHDDLINDLRAFASKYHLSTYYDVVDEEQYDDIAKGYVYISHTMLPEIKDNTTILIKTIEIMEDEVGNTARDLIDIRFKKYEKELTNTLPLWYTLIGLFAFVRLSFWSAHMRNLRRTDQYNPIRLCDRVYVNGLLTVAYLIISTVTIGIQIASTSIGTPMMLVATGAAFLLSGQISAWIGIIISIIVLSKS